MQSRRSSRSAAKKNPPQSLASESHVSRSIRNGVTPSPALARPLPHSKNAMMMGMEAPLPVVPSTIPSPLVTKKMVKKNQGPPPRRSGRERTSTVIQIDGHTVLKQNNYVLKGLGYEYGDNTIVAPPKKQKRPSTASQTQPRKTARVPTSAETARQTHNLRIQRRIASKADARLQHLATHQEILEPFLDDATRRKLSAVPKTTAVESHQQELFLQPEAIQADMRDYQLAGLNWMVKMHHKNLGMIL